ncbi:MAG: acyloxyacyl hydrolase [Cyclobacteriaceae bacterium]|nr:acyloxyacyl hydrolase [Cyclobacteriaceae bacterium]
MRKLGQVWLLVLIPLMGFGQGSMEAEKSTVYLGGRLHYGFIIPHYEELKEISQQNIWGFQLSASKLLISQKAWSNCNCYSRIGLSIGYFDYRNPDVLGHSYNALFFYEPYLNFKSRFRMSLRGEIGLNYLDKVYDEENNPRNLYYSSAISGILALALKFNYLIRDNYQLNLGFHYNHISNGGLKIPNKGMNFPTVSLGMDYIIDPVDLYGQEKRPGLKSKPLHFYNRLFWTLRTVDADENFDKVMRPLIGLEGGTIRGISNINGLLLGVEISYDGSYRELSERLPEDFSPVVFSIHGGHVFVIGRFSFTQQMAYYIYHKLPTAENSLFQRYGMFYNFGKIVSLGFSLKAHGHVAEHMDIRIGFEF